MNAHRVMLATSVALAAALASPAVAQGARNAGSQQGAEQTTTAEGQGEEIVVTAQKRVQTLVQVPQSVSVVGGETLERQQAKTFVDYAQLVPGLNIVENNPGQARIVLRGINTGSVGSTVAVYVDDAPFGASGSLSNGAILAGDFDTFDIARVEVLRGPQGTLYGSNSLGGVFKFVTNAPKLGKFEVRAQGGFETVKSGGTGYIGNAVVNVPLGETFALRASGFYHRTPGYIDRIGKPGTDIDRNDSYGGRASLLFKPSDPLSVRLFAVFQNINNDSPSTFEADPVTAKPVNAITAGSTGGKQQRYELIPEFHDIHYRLYGGTGDYDFGFSTLTAATSYSKQDQTQLSDISTNGARPLANAIYAPTAPGAVGLGYQNDIHVEKFAQELRLASPKARVFEWLIGAYYTHEKTNLFQRYLPFTIATDALIPTPGSFSGLTFQDFVNAAIDAKYREIAGFADGTLHIGEHFDLTAGTRYSHNKQSSTQIVNQLGTGTPVFGTSRQGVFTWSVSPRYQFDEDAAIYARVAKGYRPGGPNFIPAGAPANFPAEFNADTLISYEGGIKAQTHDRKVAIDLSSFYVDWKNILIVTTVNTAAGPVGVNTNGRRARSYGFEGTVTLRPVRGFSVVGNLAYTHAKLRDDTTPMAGATNLTGGLAGDDLPFTPRWSGTISPDYEWSMGADVRAFVGGNVHLQSSQKAGFNAAYRATYGKQIDLDGYTTVDLRAGVDIGRFTVQGYVRNLLDAYALTNAEGYPFAVPAAIGGQAPTRNLLIASTLRRRTIGATVGVKF